MFGHDSRCLRGMACRPETPGATATRRTRGERAAAESPGYSQALELGMRHRTRVSGLTLVSLFSNDFRLLSSHLVTENNNTQCKFHSNVADLLHS